MRANPGGHISPSEVVGRDELIVHLWRILENQSLVLSAERRMGKTCLIRKMKEEAPKGWIAVFNDLERVSTPSEFVQAALGDIETYMARIKKLSHQMGELRKQLSGLRLGLVHLPRPSDPHWKDLFIKAVESLAAHQNRRLVFFWDEVPLMLDKIKVTAGEREAMELLDTLRYLRQMCPKLRMVFTGSIGLHHVLSDLRRSGYTNTPINDMRREEVPVLGLEEGRRLACLLFEGEGIRAEDPAVLGRELARMVDGIPYFIHHVVSQAALDKGELTSAKVEEIVLLGLTHPMDAWDMRHYRNRIDFYFGETEKKLALAVLDILAYEPGALPFQELFNLVKAQVPTEDGELLRETILLLINDHYLAQDPDGSYRFKFSLVRQWWRLHRGAAG